MRDPQDRADRQPASAKVALATLLDASAVGPKRSFRRLAVTKAERDPTKQMRLGWLARAAFFLIYALGWYGAGETFAKDPPEIPSRRAIRNFLELFSLGGFAVHEVGP